MQIVIFLQWNRASAHIPHILLVYAFIDANITYFFVNASVLPKVVHTLHQFAHSALEGGHLMPVHLIGVQKDAVHLQTKHAGKNL